MIRRSAAEGKSVEQRNKRMKRMQRRMKGQDPGGCKIPWKPGEPDETDILQGCHIISQAAYLDHIAEDHHVLHWWFDPRKILEAMERSGMMAIETLEPSKIPAKDCTTRYACNWHDHDVYAEIDTGNLDIGCAEHRFLLGFRAMAGSLAAWQAPVAYARIHRRDGSVLARLEIRGHRNGGYGFDPDRSGLVRGVTATPRGFVTA